MAAGREPPAAFGPADRALFELLSAQNLVLRAGLCTLARLGVALRKADPDRAAAWADAISRHPVYKAGQFLFDLMEWEDFMLDGPPPPLAPDLARDLAVQLADILGLNSTILAEAELPAAALPDLESGFYLYRDVVLGLIALATSSGRMALG
ncbi:hypothetical protein LJR225_002882 [Phenylobacterium sp. LjRoot225]|uniref:hypothetical protein n=1 Tax=Phenylobacterium sp. LjRoot225 TaxID=3342285 RepID=UPI003ECFF018